MTWRHFSSKFSAIFASAKTTRRRALRHRQAMISFRFARASARFHAYAAQLACCFIESRILEQCQMLTYPPRFRRCAIISVYFRAIRWCHSLFVSPPGDIYSDATEISNTAFITDFSTQLIVKRQYHMKPPCSFRGYASIPANTPCTPLLFFSRRVGYRALISVSRRESRRNARGFATGQQRGLP